MSQRPGEVAGADYGYVGPAPGHISLYKGWECVVKNISGLRSPAPPHRAHKENGDWQDEHRDTLRRRVEPLKPRTFNFEKMSKIQYSATRAGASQRA